MAQRTDVEESPNPLAETPIPPEAHSAATPPDPHRQSLFRARPGVRIVLIAAIIGVLIAGILAWRYFASYESTDDAQVDGHLMPLSARIPGYVAKVNVNDNQAVRAGTVLVEIDPRDYQAALNQARAALADAQSAAEALQINVPIMSVSTMSQASSAQADVLTAQAGVAAAQQQSDAAAAQLAQVEANDVRAQNDVARYKQLADKQEISQQTYDLAVAAARSSSAAVEAARASAAAARQQIAQARGRLDAAGANLRASETGPRQVASLRARVSSANATVKQREAAVEQTELNLEYTKIIAPVDGVAMKSVEVGMNVQPGQQLVTIVPLADVWITANFKETQLRDMRPGQAVKIRVDANGRTYSGRVDSVAGSSGARLSLLPPENATGNYVKVVQRVPVKILLDQGQDNDHYLRLGMSVEPKVYLK
jgi:membrane fusion protein (multidrug efflux system)